MQISDILQTMDYGKAPEDSTIVADWLARHENGFGHFIDGAFTDPGETFEVQNPATAEVIAHVTQGSEAHGHRRRACGAAGVGGAFGA